MFEFGLPWLFLLLPMPFFYRRALPTAAENETALQVPFFLRAQSASEASQISRSGRWPPRLILTLAWFCLLAGAAQPKFTGEPIELPNSGRDLMLAVDISKSMRSADMVIDQRRFPRIVVVKSILKDFLKRREGDRVGLILFGTQAYLQAPLTFDLKTVAQFIEEAELGLAGENTAIGDAIGLAIKRLKDKPEGERVLILLTDGANTAGVNPLDTIELANISQVKIHTIGVEAENIWRRSGLDETLLASIAKKTGGQYFRARNPEELAQIYATLDQIEEIKQGTEYFRPQQSLYYYPLFASILLLLCALAYPLLSARGRH